MRSHRAKLVSEAAELSQEREAGGLRVEYPAGPPLSVFRSPSLYFPALPLATLLSVAMHAALAAIMSAATLHYFPVYGRAEAARMILKYYGVPFTDHEISMEEWGGLKASNFAEFGQLPRLDIDGMELVQSHCIYRYLSQKYGAYPTDEYEIYLVESITDLRDDVLGPLGGMVFRKEFDKVQTFFAEKMPTFLRMIEKRLCDNDREGRFFVGRRVSMADFIMFQFGFDNFYRPGKRELYEGLLQANAPTFHAFVQYFRNANEHLRRYLDTRADRAF